MTICVAVKVHDCLVLAADSATSLVGVDAEDNPAVVNVFSHGNKVFNLLRGAPVAAMTCGMGNIGRTSISSLAKELRRRMSDGGIDYDNYTIQQIATAARALIYEEAYLNLGEPPRGNHSLEFYVGGYGSNGDDAELWKVSLINGECPPPEPQMPDTDSFLIWAGQPEPLNRLILGFSSRLPEALLAGGLEQERLQGVMELIREYTATSLVEPAMPIGDAIDLAEYLVDMTKKYVHFYHGADTVGGDTDVATVTRYEGFKWIRRKHFYPANLNLETDHV